MSKTSIKFRLLLLEAIVGCVLVRTELVGPVFATIWFSVVAMDFLLLLYRSYSNLKFSENE